MCCIGQSRWRLREDRGRCSYSRGLAGGEGDDHSTNWSAWGQEMSQLEDWTGEGYTSTLLVSPHSRGSRRCRRQRRITGKSRDGASKARQHWWTREWKVRSISTLKMAIEIALATSLHAMPVQPAMALPTGLGTACMACFLDMIVAGGFGVGVGGTVR